MSSTVQTIQLSGVLDSVSGGRLRQEAFTLLDGESSVILLDCQDLMFIDSSGLGALVMLLKRTREVDKQLVLCSINDQVRMLLELTGMDGVFSVFPNQHTFLNQMQ